jgi:hypothetical protein
MSELLGAEPEKPAVVEDLGGIRMFSDAKLQTAVERALSQLDDKHRVAVVAHVDRDGVSLTSVVKIRDEWSIMVPCYKPFKGKLSVAAAVVWTPDFL